MARTKVTQQNTAQTITLLLSAFFLPIVQSGAIIRYLIIFDWICGSGGRVGDQTLNPSSSSLHVKVYLGKSPKLLPKAALLVCERV